MASVFSGLHKDHFEFLCKQPLDVILSFARASIDYILNGVNPKSYAGVARKYEVDVEKIQNVVESFAYLLIECYKYNVDRTKFGDLFVSVNFDKDQIEALHQFYEEQKPTLEKLFTKTDIEPFFYDLQWRFEAKIGSRALLNQTTPIVTMNLKTADNPKAALAQDIRNNLLQTDPNTLIQITNSLEKALQFSQSNATRKIEKKIRKVVLKDS